MLHTPTSQPLFIRHKSAAELLEKQAAAVARMPDDDKRWPAQVLSEMHKQLPFLSKFDVDIEMTRIEPEAGYALGYAMLRNKTGKQRAAEELGKPTNKIRVPVIVADRLLQPFHVFEVGGKTYPLTQERVESAMMNPSMFDGISDPPGTQSLLDQIYPPFQHRQGYGMMSGDRATTGLSKLSSAPRVTKTASGELGPLREFLRQQEVEKVAFNAQVVQGARRVGQFFSGIAGGLRGASRQLGANLITRRGATGAVGTGLAGVGAGLIAHAPTPAHAALGGAGLLVGGGTAAKSLGTGVLGAAREGFTTGAAAATPGKLTEALEGLAVRRGAMPRAAPPPAATGAAAAAPPPAATGAAAAAPPPAATGASTDLTALAADPHGWSAYLASHNLPPNMSLDALQRSQASYQAFLASKPGRKMSFRDFLTHAPPSETAGAAAQPGLLRRALNSTAGGATMLGLGAIGGGMMMANKASENY